MSGRVILLLHACLLLAWGIYANPRKPGKLAATYQKAEQFFSNSNPTNTTDSLALAGFAQVIQQLEKTPDRLYDSLLFQSYLKTGILLDVKNNNAAAKESYLKAVAIRFRNTSLSD